MKSLSLAALLPLLLLLPAPGCVTDAPDDNQGLGGECFSWRECSGVPGTPICFTGADEGYCSTGCDDDTDCPDNGFCWTSFETEGNGLCVLDCTDNEFGFCRSDLFCEPHPVSGRKACVWGALAGAVL